MLRIVVPLTFALTAGCATDPEISLHQEIDPTRGLNRDLTISVDGDARLMATMTDLQTTVLDPATLADLRAQIEAAQFRALAHDYGCVKEFPCEAIDSGNDVLTVQLDRGPITVTMNSFQFDVHSNRMPAPLVAVMDSLLHIIQHSDWH